MRVLPKMLRLLLQYPVAIKARKARQDSRVLKVIRAIQVYKALPEQQDHRVCKDLKVYREKSDRKVLRVYRAYREKTAYRLMKALSTQDIPGRKRILIKHWRLSRLRRNRRRGITRFRPSTTNRELPLPLLPQT